MPDDCRCPKFHNNVSYVQDSNFCEEEFVVCKFSNNQCWGDGDLSNDFPDEEMIDVYPRIFLQNPFNMTPNSTFNFDSRSPQMIGGIYPDTVRIGYIDSNPYFRRETSGKIGCYADFPAVYIDYIFPRPTQSYSNNLFIGIRKEHIGLEAVTITTRIAPQQINWKINAPQPFSVVAGDIISAYNVYGGEGPLRLDGIESVVGRIIVA
ncbi:MAG: hypothetical protein Hyperionvirus29_23 [Hyperionvirus sp.]|uniref:Uncharacterized protein n=1 Tax=Hyperionvirus sp. TaxID=2487770 RepID=A0A3G5ABJ7_9VIRU|nr:MAG: hypothetical protein Hyperionvirus29_23 [Hyperionvirus sp.]